MKKPSIFKHFISIGTGTVVNMLVGFLTTPVLTRLVGTAEYGQYSIFTMYASIALMVLCMGFDQALIRYFSALTQGIISGPSSGSAAFCPLCVLFWWASLSMR